MNTVNILGTITKDIDLRYAPSGTAIGLFSIAYNEKRKDISGNYNDVAHFFDVTAFGKKAEVINQYFHKGSRILIQGSLDYQSWTDANGQKRSRVVIKLNDFDFIDKANNSSAVPNSSQQYQQQAPRTDYQQLPNDEPSPFQEFDDGDDGIPF